MSESTPMSCPFTVGIAPIHGGYREDGQWIWCGSIQYEDGQYHMLASRWSKATAFAPNWLTNSRVVRAVSDQPEGPYRYVEDVLPPRADHHWDAKATHNPTVHRWGDTWYLFYTGIRYDGPTPTTGQIDFDDPQRLQARASQRIGVATAKKLSGLWERHDAPVLEVRPGHWDAFMTTNPAPVIHDDGRVLLFYKSTEHDRGTIRYGVAEADHPMGPYRRVREDSIFKGADGGSAYEDAYVWHDQRGYHMIFNDLRGTFTGEDHAGGYAFSENGLDWTPAGKSYSRTVQWDDGTTTVQGSFERPQLLFHDGVPTHITAATADGPGGFRSAENTWHLVIPMIDGDA